MRARTPRGAIASAVVAAWLWAPSGGCAGDDDSTESNLENANTADPNAAIPSEGDAGGVPAPATETGTGTGTDTDATRPETPVPPAGESNAPATTDPGNEPWVPVPRDQVQQVCGLDPDLLDEADAAVARRYGIVRHGRLCHEYYPGSDSEETTLLVFSATKTLGAATVGIAIEQSQHLEASGRKTGPLGEFQRVDHWFDLSGSLFNIHPDATLAHVMAMVGYSRDLSFGSKLHSYDAVGTREINVLSPILNTLVGQDPERLGADLEQFVQRHVYAPLGMRHSTWSDGNADKSFASEWVTTVRDMLRLGLLINNGGAWNGRQLMSAQYAYNIIHPVFEDGNTGYGYLTWLNGADHLSQLASVTGLGLKSGPPADPCAPLAIHRSYPHGISKAPDCQYPSAEWSCEQTYDVGAWSANGLNGNYIYGHRGLDMVIAVQDYGTINLVDNLWTKIRPAVVAHDPAYAGDDEAFCEAYAANEHAPDLQLWPGGL